MIKPLSSCKIVQNVGNAVNKGFSILGSKIADNNGGFDKFIKKFEPTGANNSFLGLVTLMVCMVITPRVITAARRNPDNKEATMDEIKEILFRDIQTVLIILFSLKSIDALVGRIASKIKGLPMTTKPYKKLFETTKKGFEGIKEKGREILFHPLQKLKTLGKNVLDTLHPTGGVRKYSNDEFIQKYSGYSSIDEIKKMFEEIKKNGGKPDKIFNNVMSSIIKKQENIIKTQNEIAHAGFSGVTSRPANILTSLKSVKDAGLEGLNNPDLDKNVQELIIDFFKDSNNSLVLGGKRLGAALRTGALGLEIGYLGFGLPALNQRRLEKKYLNSDKRIKIKEKYISDATSPSFIKNNIKAHEVNLYNNFMSKKK